MASGFVRAMRLIAMIDDLKGRAWTVAELADRHHVTIRTIQRDLADLQGSPTYAPLVRRVIYRNMDDCDKYRRTE